MRPLARIAVAAPGLVLCWAVLLAASLRGQESAPSVDSAPVVDRIVDRANHQNPYFSAQGVKALKAQGEAAAIPALQRFIARRSIHALAPLVVEWLGDTSDHRGRAILRDAIGNLAFPWRPQAAKALGRAPRAEETELFIGLAADRLPAVREPALLALGELADRVGAARPRVLAALEGGLRDPLFEPRLAAAEALLKAGERSPLPVLVEALGVERRFFEIDFGVTARRRAWAAIEARVGPDIAFDPSAPPSRSAEVVALIARRLVQGGESRPSPVARAPASLAGDVEDAVFGIEIRSCRVGDQWVRFTSGGDLVLGHYDLSRKALDPERAAEIGRLLRELTGAEGVEIRRDPGAYFGRPGCDYEKWYLPEESGLLRVTVGLEGRPEALRKMHAAIAAAIESAFGAPAAEEFRDRAAPFGRPDEED